MTPEEIKRQAVIERRDQERLVAQFPVRFSVISREEADALLTSGAYSEIVAFADVKSQLAKKRSLQAMAENISLSGLKLVGDLQMVGNEPIENGSVLFVELGIPDVAYSVHALARVIWSHRQEKGSRFVAGLLFIGIHKQDLARVERYIFLQKRAEDAALKSGNTPAHEPTLLYDANADLGPKPSYGLNGFIKRTIQRLNKFKRH